MYAGDVVTGVDSARRSDCGVDAAGHRGQDLHDGQSLVERARSTTGAIASRTAATSASVEV